MKINPDRLLADLKRLRSFGAYGTGVVRPAFSHADMEARRWLRQKMEEAGLDAEVDGVGNVFGRSRVPGRAVLLGSHSDSQPRGGWLDGALGVIYALEVVRTFTKDQHSLDYAIDVASWADEEGAYLSMLGSLSFCGMLKKEEVRLARSHLTGLTLVKAFEEAGLSGSSSFRIIPDRYHAYLEAHIEQGPYLDNEGLLLGVVTAITGIRTCRIVCRGQQNHAGTTPMANRRDAGKALIQVAGVVEREFSLVAGPETVWTTGHIHLEPGMSNVIPGRAEMLVEFRDIDSDILNGMEEKLEEIVKKFERQSEVVVSVEAVYPHVEPTKMDHSLQEILAMAAETHAKGRWVRMSSGAGHDAQVLANHLPTGMLFVPSIGGISHDIGEDTREEDIIRGAQSFATAVELLFHSLSGNK